MFSQLFTSNNASKRYQSLGSFTPNTPSVHALSISNDGCFVACGGTDGVLVWNVDKNRQLTRHDHESLGTVSCMTWVKTKHSMAETICYRTGLGYLVFLRPNPADQICARRLGSGFEITCLAWDIGWSEPGARIAVGTHDNMVQILILSTGAQLQSVFAGRLDSMVPKSIAFIQRGSVHVFGLYDGKVIKLNNSNGAVLSEHQYGSVIGYAAVSNRRELVVIDNTTNGFTLYSLDSDDAIRTFFTDALSVPVPKQVAFGEESKVVIGGSDHGVVYVFERRSGKLLEKIVHASTGLVQTISVRDVGGRCIVASASPTQGHKKALVKVWVHRYSGNGPKCGSSQSVHKWIKNTIASFFVIVLLLTVGFWLQENVDLGSMLTLSLPGILYNYLPTGGIQSQWKWDPPKSMNGKLKIHPQSDIAVLKELAEQLMVLAEQAYWTGEDSQGVDKCGESGCALIEDDSVQVIYL